MQKESRSRGDVALLYVQTFHFSFATCVVSCVAHAGGLMPVASLPVWTYVCVCVTGAFGGQHYDGRIRDVMFIRDGCNLYQTGHILYMEPSLSIKEVLYVNDQWKLVRLHSTRAFSQTKFSSNYNRKVKRDQTPTTGMDYQPNINVVPEIDDGRGSCSTAHPALNITPSSGFRNEQTCLIYFFY